MIERRRGLGSVRACLDVVRRGLDHTPQRRLHAPRIRIGGEALSVPNGRLAGHAGWNIHEVGRRAMALRAMAVTWPAAGADATALIARLAAICDGSHDRSETRLPRRSPIGATAP